MEKCCTELLPVVFRDPPFPCNGSDDDPYGTLDNPVTLHVVWKENPGAAMRRLYAISQQPDGVRFVNELWRQAWPKTLWSELLCDGIPAVLSPATYCNGPVFMVNIQLSSDEPLWLPWDWLAQVLLHAPAAGLNYCLNADGVLQLQGQLPYIRVSVRRCAQAGRFQTVMYKTLYHGDDTWSGNEDTDDTCTLPWWDDYI